MGGVVNPVTRQGGVGHIGGEHSFWGMIPPKSRVAETLAHATATVSRTEVEDGSVASYLNLVGTTHPVGSVAYKLMRVAAGVEDLTFSVQPKSEWDICGGIALLVATGKRYSRLGGNPVKFNQLRPLIASGAVAGNRRLVLEFLQKYTMLRHGYGGALASNGKPRTTDSRPWPWGASLRGSSEHSPRSNFGAKVSVTSSRDGFGTGFIPGLTSGAFCGTE